MTKSIILVVAVSAFALSPLSGTPSASAQSMAACEKQAVSQGGKPLSGAAKTASITKCMKTACEANAVDKNGKKLAGATRDSFLKKCEQG